MTNRRLRIWATERGIDKQEPSNNNWEFVCFEIEKNYNNLRSNGVKGYVLNILEELLEYSEAKRDGIENDWIDSIQDSRVYGATELIKEGYCISDCDDEVLKVIESRVGAFDENLGKWVKFTDRESKSKWYEPDYVGNCKFSLIETRFIDGLLFH